MGLLALNRQPNEPPRCPCLRRRCPTWRPELQEGLTLRSLRGQSGVALANRPNPACRAVHASIPGTHTHISQSVLHQARLPCQCFGSRVCRIGLPNETSLVCVEAVRVPLNVV